MKSFLLVITLLLSVFVYTPSVSDAKSLPNSFADEVEELMPAVVNISSTQLRKKGDMRFKRFSFPDLPEGHPFEDFKDLFDNMEPHNDQDGNSFGSKPTSLGSGFIISKDGYIVTNNHVIMNAEEITVKFSDDTKAAATVVGSDKKTDLALLKVEVDYDLPFVSFGDSDKVRVGDWVIAIGNPFGLGSSVSAGIVSARARDINAGPFDDFIQTDAAINKGNSGGPLFNIDGKVIGINTAIFSPSGGSVGVGFAVPSSLAEPVIAQLKKHGHAIRAWLGVKIQTVTEEIADSIGMKEPKGALVVEISKDSPAAKSSIKTGDVIIKFDGKDIPTMKKLPRIVAESEIGKTVDVVVWRQGKEKTVKVKLAELKEEKKQIADAETDESSIDEIPGKSELLDMQLVQISDKLKEQYAIPEDVTEGLLVVSVDRQSDSYRKGIRSGDVILLANQEHIAKLKDLKKVLKNAKKKKRKSVLLLINRSGDTIFIAVPIKE
ncbi:MAG: Do family serine endopeptidase [Rickettsiales bacterium]|nr:Do family serine endopeptidase [Rickettsiales bacterium]